VLGVIIIDSSILSPRDAIRAATAFVVRGGACSRGGVMPDAHPVRGMVLLVARVPFGC
jgi:hypothetical protein